MTVWKKLMATAGIMVFACNAHATVLSFNFVGGSTDYSGASMLSTDEAGTGLARVANWNNLSGDFSSGTTGFVYDNGAASNATITYQTDLGTWALPASTLDDGDDRMWRGYLDAEYSAEINVTGLNFFDSYDVYVYFDGDNRDYWRKGIYSIGAVSEDGEDTEGTNWGSGNNVAQVYQLPEPGFPWNETWPVWPNNDEGNYVVLSGITGDGFTLVANGGLHGGDFDPHDSDVARAPINGFQIVGTVIPEPTSLALMGLGLAGLGFARKKLN